MLMLASCASAQAAQAQVPRSDAPVALEIRQELIHPDSTYSDIYFQFSPDGTKLIGGSYAGSVVALWELSSGRLISTIKAKPGLRRSGDYFHIAPDWKTVYVADYRSSLELINKDRRRFSFQGYVRAWNLETGELMQTYKHDPERGILGMELFRTVSTSPRLRSCQAIMRCHPSARSAFGMSLTELIGICLRDLTMSAALHLKAR